MWLRRTCACAAATKATATISTHPIACRVDGLDMAESIRRIGDAQRGIFVNREHAYEEILARVYGSDRRCAGEHVEWDSRRTGHASADHVHQRRRADFPATV